MAKLGRPSKYNDDLLEKAEDYLVNYRNYGDVVPSHAGLAVELDITRKTLYEWSHDPEKQAFSDILDRCNKVQERLLLSGSLLGDLNPSIAKLMLGKHGYSEKSIQELTGANGGAIKTESTWTIQPVKPKDADS